MVHEVKKIPKLINVVAGFSGEKDIQTILKILSTLPNLSSIFIVKASHERAATVESILNAAKSVDVKVHVISQGCISN